MHIAKSWADRFLPSNYKIEDARYTHFKMLIHSSFWTGALAFGYGVMSFFIEFRIGILTMVISAVVFMIIPFLVKAGMNNYLGSNIFIGTIVIVSTFLISQGGGLSHSSTAIYLIMIPLFGLLLIGPRMGFVWLIIVGTEILIFGILQMTGVEFPVTYPSNFHHLFALLAYLGIVVIVFIITNTFDVAKNDAMDIVAEKNVELDKEKKISDDLLLNILPKKTAEELKRTGSTKARLYPMTTILFSDFVGFTSISEKLTPEDLVALIDHYFRAFDEIVGYYNIEKIKTVGDAYLAAGGVPNELENHAELVVKAAQDFVAFVEKEKKNDIYFEIRIGVNTGTVVGGVVGTKKFAYDIWGDAVNVAARMESGSEPGRINISDSTYNLIKKKIKCTHRGKIEAKNKGSIDMYFVD